MMLRTPAAIAGLLALAVVASARATVPCTYDTGLGVVYDLSYLDFPGAYTVLDANAEVYNFTYFFNVCGNTAEYPYTEKTPSSACVTTTGATGETQTGPAPAWQLYNENSQCYRLGNSPTNVKWELIDEYDLTRGVSLQYLGGDACPHGWGSRSLKLHFQCADGENVLHKEPVVETDTCQYEIFLKSTFGCPTQCFGSNLKLCSSHGVCGYDTDQKAARCFCNPGYAGSFCSDTAPGDDSGLSAAGAVLIFVSILLVIVLGVLFTLWRRIKSLRLDPAAYGTLAGGPDDIGDGFPTGTGAGAGGAVLATGSDDV